VNSTHLMLLTLAAAARAEEGEWPGVPGLDALEEDVAVAAARERGFLDFEGRLTGAGRDWARARLARLAPLIAALGGAAPADRGAPAVEGERMHE